MIQWVASPLNHGYSFLTGMSGKGKTAREKERHPLLRERTGDDPNLDRLVIYRWESCVQTLTCRFVICIARIKRGA